MTRLEQFAREQNWLEVVDESFVQTVWFVRQQRNRCEVFKVETTNNDNITNAKWVIMQGTFLVWLGS